MGSNSAICMIRMYDFLNYQVCNKKSSTLIHMNYSLKVSVDVSGKGSKLFSFKLTYLWWLHLPTILYRTSLQPSVKWKVVTDFWIIVTDFPGICTFFFFHIRALWWWLSLFNPTGRALMFTLSLTLTVHT